MSWVMIFSLAGGCYFFKLGGLVAANTTRPTPRLNRVLSGLTPAVLAGLIAVQTLDGGGTLNVGAGTVGLLVGGLAARRGAPFAWVLVVAAGVTAALRLL
jgi:uncharacterized membrane protein